MRRLGIFLFYDAKGRVSPHVHTALKAFSPYCDDLIFVANGNLDMETYEGLEDIVSDLLQRENKGFDVWGYKAGIEHVGYENLGNYDEIVLFNYTFFAPLSDLGAMFSEMDARQDIDAWGMTEYADAGKSFLQSYFLCSRKSLHAGQDFMDYWNEMPMIHSIDDSLDFHEFRFSRHFRDLGYTLEPYIKNRDDWDGNTTLTDLAGQLDAGMPICKYRAFNFDPDVIEARGGRKISGNFKLIEEKTAYPVSEVWSYIIDQTPPDALISSAELCRIVSGQSQSGSLDGLFIIATLEDPETLDMAFSRLDKVAPQKVLVASDNSEIQLAAQKRGYKTDKPGLLRMSLSLINDLAGQEDLAIVHLSDFAQERNRYFFKDMLFKNYWDPLLCQETVNWLATEDHMGLLFSFPDAVAGISSYRLGTGRSLDNWEPNYRPDFLLRAARQDFWPWRGNMIMRKSLATNPILQSKLGELLKNVVLRDNESVAGPEGALPELVREQGFASGIVVPQSESVKLLLRSASRTRSSKRQIGEMANKFRKEKQRSPARSGYLSGRSGNRARLISRGLFGQNGYILDSNGEELKLKSGLSLRCHFEKITTDDNRIYVRGWAFDKKNPHDFLEIGLLDRDTFIVNPEPLIEARPDVLEVFNDLPIVERSGFDLSVDGVTGSNNLRYRICFVNRTQREVCVMHVSRIKMDRALRQLARRGLSRLQG